MKFVLPASVFIAVFFNHYLMHEFPSLPNRFQYLSDLIIVAVGAVVILRVTLLRRVRLIPIGYWLVFIAFTYVVVAGAVVNHVSPEITFAGIRFYFKYVPLFLIPIAYDYDARDVKRLWIMLIALSLLQLPVALHQRFIEYSGDPSGDKIAGTLGLSTSLSLFLVAMITVVAALYIDKQSALKISSSPVSIVPTPRFDQRDEDHSDRARGRRRGVAVRTAERARLATDDGGRCSRMRAAGRIRSGIRPPLQSARRKPWIPRFHQRSRPRRRWIQPAGRRSESGCACTGKSRSGRAALQID